MIERPELQSVPAVIGPQQAASLLRAQSASLLERWRARVLADPRVPSADGLSKVALRDHVPLLIERIANALDASAQRVVRPSAVGVLVGQSDASRAHAFERRGEGFAIPEALRELGHLRLATLELFEAQGCVMDASAAQTIHSALDETMSTATAELARHDRVALEAQTQIAKAERGRAEDAARVKEAFLTTLSHELRTPLNAVMGWSSILRLKGHVQGEGAAALDAIERNAKVLAGLVNDMLDASSMVAGQVRLVPSALDLAEVLRHVAETLQPLADTKRVRLNLVALPAAHVMGDRNRLVQVFWNLLTNALKFSAPDARIDVRLEPIEAWARVVITDFGEGIPAHFLPKVFERFEQAQGGDTRPRGGLGLGLAIVRELVELHGGGVTVESSGKNAGSTFTVILPRLDVPEDDG